MSNTSVEFQNFKTYHFGPHLEIIEKLSKLNVIKSQSSMIYIYHYQSRSKLIASYSDKNKFVRTKRDASPTIVI